LPNSFHRTAFALILAHTYFNFGFTSRLITARWLQIHPHLDDAARTLGASPLKLFTTVTLPLLGKAITNAALIVFTLCFTSYGVVRILGGPSRSTLETEIYFRAIQLGDVSGAMLLSALQILIIVSLFVVTTRASRNRFEQSTRPTISRQKSLQTRKQKFIATTNNIQKATLLLSVENNATPTNLTWDGDLVVSIYPLQSSIECPSDIAPNLAIDFSPYNIPIAQVSMNYDQLLTSGVQLNTVPQPVDFVFSNSSMAAGNVIVAGNYYALTIKRSGSTQYSDILIATGSNRIDNSRVTLFTTAGNLWVDIPEEERVGCAGCVWDFVKKNEHKSVEMHKQTRPFKASFSVISW
jgi:hypothetical protein